MTDEDNEISKNAELDRKSENSSPKGWAHNLPWYLVCAKATIRQSGVAFVWALMKVGEETL